MRQALRRLFIGLSLSLLLISRVAADPAATPTQRTVFTVGDIADADQIALTANLAAVRFPGVLLWESAQLDQANKQFLKRFEPDHVVPLKAACPEPLVPEKPFTRVVVCARQPRALLLQAANLAWAIRAPLRILDGDSEEAIRKQVRTGGFRDVFAVGDIASVFRDVGQVRVHHLVGAKAVIDAFFKHRLSKLPIQTLVVANPADADRGGMSRLAPWIAYQKKALLLLTDEDGTNVKSVVAQALKRPELAKVDAVIMAGNLKALPMECRPNPIAGGRDAQIEMEPLTPSGNEAHSFAVGRLFHQDPAVVALMLARARLFPAQNKNAPGVMVVSNPGGGLPFLETLSRNTVQEFRNAGYSTTSLIGRRANSSQVRKLLPEQSIFLWEGHHSTLFRDYEIHRWKEPLNPSLIFLQSCMALAEEKTHHFFERGSVGVIGSSTRTYSGSGGAFALAYFNAMIHNRQTLGGALRHAKNFMLAFALLKEKRLGDDAKLSGANLRAAWAFTLWGDPTVQLPRPAALPKNAVAHHVRGNTVAISLPDSPLEKVINDKYVAAMSPNARLAGLVRINDDEQHQLVPLVFVEVALPRAPEGKTPTLRTRLPDRNWVFSWDARRRCGYLLVTPRNRDRGELRFQVEWN